MSTEKEKLTGYKLRERLRRARKVHTLNATEQAVYQELSDICNEKEWPEIFYCKNEDVYGELNITDNTFRKAREALIAAGILYCQSNKSKRQHSAYSFISEIPCESAGSSATSSSNFEVDSEPSSATSSAGSSATSSSNFEVHTNNKEETKTQTETAPKGASAQPQGGGSAKKIGGDKKNRSGAARKIFIAPQLPEIQAYFRELQWPEWAEDRINHQAMRFFDHYTSNGWKVGRVGMSDWRAAIRKWIDNDFEKFKTNGSNQKGERGSHQQGHARAVIQEGRRDYGKP